MTNTPHHPELTEIEQNLLDELNYKAKLILDIENLFESKKIPCPSKTLYSFEIDKLENILEIWNK
tara:strand:+ start:2963 stop:3157 length:195 start_codon:yes stop_codon:yes gene_type:complete